MKKTLLLAPILLTAFTLTGCAQSISQEAFTNSLKEVENHILHDNSDIKNVRVRNKIQHSFDYKEGEFYRYYQFALIMTETVCTWKENGKYYHYYHNTFTPAKDFDSEITEEEFNTYMAGHREDILEVMFQPITTCDKLLSDLPTEFDRITNSFYKDGNKVIMKSKAERDTKEYDAGSEKDVTKVTNYTFTFSNKLPKQYTSKGESETNWKYSYGDAKFISPHNEDNN